jgi:hypothetical protein
MGACGFGPEGFGFCAPVFWLVMISPLMPVSHWERMHKRYACSQRADSEMRVMRVNSHSLHLPLREI